MATPLCDRLNMLPLILGAYPPPHETGIYHCMNRLAQAAHNDIAHLHLECWPGLKDGWHSETVQK